jgi:uncharacterized membrane protein YedE/YeeE
MIAAGLLIVACLFAALLGFAAHRASICTLRAVSEVMSARTGFMLVSIFKSALWVIALTLPFIWLAPATASGINGWTLTGTALAGGFVFGIGAALNGACAYSTMARLMDGEARMVISIAGFAIGIMVFIALVDGHWLARPTRTPALIGTLAVWSYALAAFLLAFMLYEIARLWRERARNEGMMQIVCAKQYRLSSAALLIALSSSLIFLLIGSPGYTITMQNLVEGAIGTRVPPAADRWILLLAVLAGMLISTLERGSFRLDWRPRLDWLRNVAGGVLMGLGTAMLPGGNDALILYGIPSLSPHALPAYLALIAGAAAGLYAMKHFAGLETRVVCRNDIYLAEAQPKNSILNSHAPRG